MKAQYDLDQRPVFGVDIDGTLAQYHTHFRHFAEAWVGRPLGPGAMEPYDYGVPFNEYLGLGKPTYRQIKLAYRRGGLKRSMPAYPHASEFTRALRDNGALIVICTTRPYLHHDGIEGDTLEWLRRNRIQFDFIKSGERKYIDLANRFGDRVVAVFDDLPEMCRQADSKGLLAVQVWHEANLSHRASYSPQAYGLKIAEGVAMNELDKWRAAR